MKSNSRNLPNSSPLFHKVTSSKLNLLNCSRICSERWCRKDGGFKAWTPRRRRLWLKPCCESTPNCEHRRKSVSHVPGFPGLQKQHIRGSFENLLVSTVVESSSKSTYLTKWLNLILFRMKNLLLNKWFCTFCNTSIKILSTLFASDLDLGQITKD